MGSAFAEIGQAKIFVVLHCPVDIPLAGEQQQVLALVVLNDLGVGGEGQGLDIEIFLVVLDPADQRIGQSLLRAPGTYRFRFALPHLEQHPGRCG